MSYIKNTGGPIDTLDKKRKKLNHSTDFKLIQNSKAYRHTDSDACSYYFLQTIREGVLVDYEKQVGFKQTTRIQDCSASPINTEKICHYVSMVLHT